MADKMVKNKVLLLFSSENGRLTVDVKSVQLSILLCIIIKKLPVSVGYMGTSANRQAVVMETLAGEERPL